MKQTKVADAYNFIIVKTAASLLHDAGLGSGWSCAELS